MNPIIVTTPEELRAIIFDTVQAIMHPDSAPSAAHADKSSGAASESKPMSVTEAAKYLGLAIQTLYGYTSKRMIPFIKRGKKLWFLKTELDGWLLEGRKESVAHLRQKIASGKG